MNYRLVKKKDSIYKYRLRHLDYQVLLQENLDAKIVIRFHNHAKSVKFEMHSTDLKNPVWYIGQAARENEAIFQEMEALVYLTNHWAEILLLLHTLDRLGKKEPAYIAELCECFHVKNDAHAAEHLSALLIEELLRQEEFQEYQSFAV